MSSLNLYLVHYYVASWQFNISSSIDSGIKLDAPSLISGIVFDRVYSLERFCIHYQLNGTIFYYKDNVLSLTPTVSKTFVIESNANFKYDLPF